MRDYNTLTQLDWVLGQPEAEGRDVVVLTVRVLGPGARHAGHRRRSDVLGLRADAVHEGRGDRGAARPARVSLLVTPGTNIFDALAQSAVQLRSGLIVVGESEIMTPEQQAHLLGEAWDRTPHDSPTARTRFLVLCKDGRVKRVLARRACAGPVERDIERIHRSGWKR